MSTEAWITLVAGVVLGFIGNILANAINDRVLRSFAAQKNFVLSRRKRSALKHYRALREIHRMKPELKVLRAIRYSTVTITGLLLVVMLLIVIGFSPNVYLEYGARTLAGFMILTGFLSFWSLRRDLRLLEDFDAYERQIKERWPEEFEGADSAG